MRTSRDPDTLSRMRIPILTAVAAVALLAGCSSAAKPAAPTATPSPSPTVSTATITQYASKLNGPLSDFSTSWEKARIDCVIPPTARLCGVELLTLNIEAKTIGLVIDNSQSKSATTYIGLPPAELASLVAMTQADANAVEQATANSDSPADGWAGLAGKLASDIEEWGPYLH
jgi:hypothetical protein